jgi:hypothetical protein
VDRLGREVVLRGLVVTTNTIYIDPDEGGMKLRPLELKTGDYERMRDWGFNLQVIRLEGARMGAGPECAFEPDYLDKLEKWTDMAEAHGLYTMFKMTTYDMPTWGAGSAFNPQRWQQFWEDVDDQRNIHLRSWNHLFSRFKGRACVIGYDVLNEPHKGTDTEPFYEDYLFPYYRRAAEALRKVDSEALLCFQPGVMVFGDGALPELDDPGKLYVPHFYLRNVEQYGPRMAQLLAQARSAQCPMVVAEYGLPERALGRLLPAWTPELGRATAILLDRHGLGWARVWYDHTPLWGVLNADWTEQRAKMDILSRPYPRRLAGRAPSGWSFDFDRKVFEVEIDPVASARGPTELFVAASRHYPEGFSLEINGSQYTVGPAEVDELRRLGDQTDGSVSLVPSGEFLFIRPRAEKLTVRIEPL